MPGRADGGGGGGGGGPVAVVIPAYQAAATIATVVTGALRACPDATFYVVDDGAGDETREWGRGKGATVLVHPRNLGKGAALRTGIDRALADGAAIVVTLDADGQHPPEEIPRLVAPIAAGEADLVLGARARTRAMPHAQTGFRALARQAAELVRPSEVRYDFEAAFLLEALARGLRVRSVPIATIYGGRPSHFRHWEDTWRLARVFTRYGRRIMFGAR